MPLYFDKVPLFALVIDFIDGVKYCLTERQDLKIPNKYMHVHACKAIRTLF